MKVLGTVHGPHQPDSAPTILCAPIDPDKPLGIHAPQLPGDVGWDLEAMESVVIRPHLSSDVAVNCRLHLPDGYYADVRNRSSMGRRGLYVDHGLIDTGYRGPLYAFVRNTTSRAVLVEEGQRVAQLVFHRAAYARVEVVSEVTEDSARGAAGFGSTGA